MDTNQCPFGNGRFWFRARPERFCNRRHSAAIPRIAKKRKRSHGPKDAVSGWTLTRDARLLTPVNLHFAEGLEDKQHNDMGRYGDGLTAPVIGPANPACGLPSGGHGAVGGGDPHQVQQDSAARNMIIVRTNDNGIRSRAFFDDRCGVDDVLQGVF